MDPVSVSGEPAGAEERKVRCPGSDDSCGSRGPQGARDTQGERLMSEHTIHEGHGDHVHGVGCGHTKIAHDGHTDYVHGGHLHTVHGGHVDECAIGVTPTNPTECTPLHACSGHAKGHAHGAACGHDAVPHGDHVDYLVDGHLHHPHGEHCDHHGAVQVA